MFEDGHAFERPFQIRSDEERWASGDCVMQTREAHQLVNILGVTHMYLPPSTEVIFDEGTPSPGFLGHSYGNRKSFIFFIERLVYAVERLVET